MHSLATGKQGTQIKAYYFGGESALTAIITAIITVTVTETVTVTVTVTVTRIKAYYIGERADKCIFMAEILVNVPTKDLKATLKCDDASCLQEFKKLLQKPLSQL